MSPLSKGKLWSEVWSLWLAGRRKLKVHHEAIMKLCKLQGETQVFDQQQWSVFGENQQAQDLITHRRGFC